MHRILRTLLLASVVALAATYVFWSPTSLAPYESASSQGHATVRWGTIAGLRYVEVVPSDAAPDEELPLVVMIHGMGDRARPIYGLRASRSTRARFILPQAPTRQSRGYTWLPYSIATDHPSLLDAIPARARQIATLIEVISTTRPTRGKAVVTGFSQGGILSFAVALLEPERVGLALPVAGYLPIELWPHHDDSGSYPPIRALHGTADPVVAYDPTREMTDTLRARGLDITLRPFPGVGHTQPPEMPRTLRHRMGTGSRL